MLHRKARAALADALEPGEQPRLLIPGLAGAAMVATDRRAFVFKAGARAGLPFGARLKAFEYESVMRVDLRPAGEVDVVVIHAPLKISTCSSYWADPRDDPWRARNAIAVTRGSETAKQSAAELSRLATEFNARATARRSEHARPHGEVRTPDVVGRIAELEQRTSRPALAGEIASVREVEPEPAAPATAASATEECPRCGNELGAGWQFCPRCGAPASEAPGRPAKAAGNSPATSPAKAGRRGRPAERRRRT
jgi:hypothetical protein